MHEGSHVCLRICTELRCADFKHMSACFSETLIANHIIALTQLALHLAWKPKTCDNIEINKNTQNKPRHTVSNVEVQEQDICFTLLLRSLFYITQIGAEEPVSTWVLVSP